MDFLSWFNLPYLNVVIDFALLVIRMLLPILAVIIVFQCFSSMRRHRRDEDALIGLGVLFELLWNSLSNEEKEKSLDNIRQSIKDLAKN